VPSTLTEIPNPTELLAPDGYADRLIRRRSKMLAGMRLFADMQCEDIEQELNLRLLRRLRKYDPSRSGIKTYITNVIRYETRELMRTQYSEKHARRRHTRSLDMCTADEGTCGLPLKDQVSRFEQVRGSGRTVQDEQEQLDLRQDLETVIARMDTQRQTVG
jgi:RNA polymerase sigma factor (sigma-70 family)